MSTESCDNEEHERVVKDLGLLAELDYCLLQEIVLECKERLNYSVHVSGLVRKLRDKYPISEERIYSSLERLGDKEIIHPYPLGKTIRTADSVLLRIGELPNVVGGWPRTTGGLETIDEGKIKELISKEILEVGKNIHWEQKKKTLLEDVARHEGKIMKMRKEIRESERRMLRSMINIFGIFVAIFSFIIISANTAIQIQPTKGFFEMLKQTTALLLPVFLFIIILLFLSIWAANRR